MTKRTGLAAILDEADAGAAVLPTDAEQLDLLGLTTARERRGPGRPAGQRNRRNQAVAAFILATHRDPLVELVKMGTLGIDDMAAALGCTRAEAFAEKRQCLTAALPYVHQRQAVAVDVTTRNIVTLAIHEAGGFDLSETPSQGADGEDFTILETVEYQQLTDGAADDV